MSVGVSRYIVLIKIHTYVLTKCKNNNKLCCNELTLNGVKNEIIKNET